MFISHPHAVRVYEKTPEHTYFVSPGGNGKFLPAGTDAAHVRSRKAYAIGNLVEELAAVVINSVHFIISIRQQTARPDRKQVIICASDGDIEEAYLVTSGDWQDIMSPIISHEMVCQLTHASRPAPFYPFHGRLSDMPSGEIARVVKEASGLALKLTVPVNGSDTLAVENVSEAIRRVSGYIGAASESGMGPVGMPGVSLGNGTSIRQIGVSPSASLYVVSNPEKQAASFRVAMNGETFDIRLPPEYHNVSTAEVKPSRRKRQTNPCLNLAEMLCGIADVDFWSFLHVDGKVTEFTDRRNLKDAMIRAANLGSDVMQQAETDRAIVLRLNKGTIACNLVNGAVYRARGVFDTDDVLGVVESHSWALIAASNAGNGRIKEEGCTFIVGPHSVNLSRYKYLQKVQGLIGPGSQYPGVARAYKGDVDTTKLGTNSLPGLMLIRDDAGIDRFYNVPGGLGYLRAIVDGELPGWFNSSSPMHPSAGWGAIPPGQSVVTYPMPESPLASFEPTPDSHVDMIRERLKNGR